MVKIVIGYRLYHFKYFSFFSIEIHNNLNSYFFQFLLVQGTIEYSLSAKIRQPSPKDDDDCRRSPHSLSFVCTFMQRGITLRFPHKLKQNLQEKMSVKQLIQHTIIGYFLCDEICLKV